MTEIERKYLVKSLPPGMRDDKLIRQGYLAYGNQMEARIRQYGDDYFLTVKEGSGLSRKETEIGITPQQFLALWPATEGRRLEKVRSLVAFGGLRIEIDRYTGAHGPLVVAEVEFTSVQESERFEKPDFLGREITEEDAYRNLSLAIHGIPGAGHDTSDLLSK